MRRNPSSRSVPARRFSRRPTSATLASRVSISTDPFPPPPVPDRSRKGILLRNWDRVLDWVEMGLLVAGGALFVAALVPSSGRAQYFDHDAGSDPIALLLYALPLGVLTFLTMGFQEFVNVGEGDPMADKVGERRNRMDKTQLKQVLALRGFMLACAAACPLLLILGPYGLTSKAPGYTHYTAEAVVLALVALIITLLLFMIADGVGRLRSVVRDERRKDVESQAGAGR